MQTCSACSKIVNLHDFDIGGDATHIAYQYLKQSNDTKLFACIGTYTGTCKKNTLAFSSHSRFVFLK